MASESNKRLPKDMQKALKIFPKVVKEKEKAAKERQRVLKNFAPASRRLEKLVKEAEGKVHPWRLCPAGQHWVASHPMSVPISEKNPSGVTIRDGHCRTNRSRKDQMYADEIIRIASEHFDKVKVRPNADRLGSESGGDFDSLIAGWTAFWNQVLAPKVPLDPNIVKALISTESDFDVNAKALASKGNWARGLMQVTDETLDILSDEKGELKDFLLDIDQNEINQPSLNICAGVRWLFHKKNLLEKRTRRQVSWEDAVMDYKAYTARLERKEKGALDQKRKFITILERLKK